MPLLGLPANFPDLAGFINSFIRHGAQPSMTTNIFILCNKEKLHSNGKVYHKLTHHDMYVDSWDYDELELLVFDLPESFHEDLSYFRKGRYSLMSEEAKNAILQIFVPTISGEVTKNFAVLYPLDPKSAPFKEELEELIGFKLTRNVELISVPDLDKETFQVSDHIDLYEADEDIKYLQLI